MNKNKKIELRRCIKEAGILYHKMEIHKWLESQKEGYDIGKPGFVDWAKLYEDSTRAWINNLSDHEIDHLFENLPERIKEKIYRKCKSN